MSLYDDLRKKLNPETFAAVTDALGDDFDFDVVPRARLNKVIGQRNQLLREKEQGTHPDDDDHDSDNDDFVDEGADKQKLGSRQKKSPAGVSKKDLEELEMKHQQEMKDLQVRFAALSTLRGANVVDPELLFDSKLLDKSKITLDDSGKLVGLEEQLKTLTEAKPFLFGAADHNPATGTGRKKADAPEGITSKEEFLKLPTDKQLEFKNANPEVFKSFLNQ